MRLWCHRVSLTRSVACTTTAPHRDTELGAMNRSNVESIADASISLAAVEDWPTTERFSRRLGQKVRGASYSAAIEGPLPEHSYRPAGVVAILVLVGLFIAAVAYFRNASIVNSDERHLISSLADETPAPQRADTIPGAHRASAPWRPPQEVA